MLNFDPNAPLSTLLSVTRNAGLASMTEAELTELATRFHERHTGQLKEAAREKDRAKRALAKARRANSP